MKLKKQMSGRTRVLDALYGKEVDRYPIISPTSVATMDNMVKVNAYFPEAHINANKMAALAATGHEILGYDTVAPYFSILLEAAALGCSIDWGTSNSMPSTKNYLKNFEDFKPPNNFLERKPIKALLEAIKILKKRYVDRVAVIGKVIGPWTLAYHLFGVQNFLLNLTIDPKSTQELLKKLLKIPISFSIAQIEAGADVITWADHATCDLVSAQAYKEYLFPFHKEAIKEITSYCPVILHTCGCVTDRITYFSEAGFTAFHFDSRNPINKLKKLAENKITLVGGVNNPQILLNGDTSEVKEQVAKLLEEGINLVAPECAVPTFTPNKNLKAITLAVNEYTRKTRNIKLS